MVFGSEIYQVFDNLLPGNLFFPIVHLVSLAVAIFLAMGAYKMKQPAWGHFFVLFALGELAQGSAHMGILAGNFSHMLQEVFLLVGMVIVAMSVKKK